MLWRRAHVGDQERELIDGFASEIERELEMVLCRRRARDRESSIWRESSRWREHEMESELEMERDGDREKWRSVRKDMSCVKWRRRAAAASKYVKFFCK